MTELEFWSDDRRFGLLVPAEQVAQVLQVCVASRGKEVGGVLIGFYTDARDCAIVEAITGAPPDSRSGKRWFNRGIRGLKQLLDRFWQKNRYYLGEWHFHPGGSAVASMVDILQMQRIANDDPYKCPEPVLLIIGGDPETEWSVRAYVFPKGKGQVELHAK